MRFNIAYINSNKGHISFQDNFATILHEITHILGFSRYATYFWRDPKTGKPYENQILEFDPNKSAFKIKTYNIVKVAQIHYNCNSIDGMYFENQGGLGTMGSHWERDLVFNEYMTGSDVSYIAVVSEFTAALLRDTGFYAEVNSNYVGELKQGQNKGCDFFDKSCSSSNKYEEFGTTSDLYKSQCVQYGIGYGYYTEYDFLSQCVQTTIYENGFCEDTLNSSNSDIQYRQSYGSGSKCFNSNVFQNGFSSSLKNYRCFKYKCSPDFKTIDIYFWKDEYVTCKTPLEVIDVKSFSSTSYGPVECPANFRQFCTYPKFCKNFCSSNGICTNGICICLSGYAGEDCSIQCASPNVYDGANCIQKCSINTFKNPDNTCKTTCPFGYFKDSSINECIICHRFCSSCTGPTSNECQSCNIGYNIQSDSCVISCHSSCTTCFGFGPNNCLSCPDTKYLDSQNQCQSCISNCKTCTNDSSCSECQPMYSFNQNQQKCISLCHSSCKTCIKPNDNTQCSSCSDGYYLSGTSCLACTSPYCLTCNSKDNTQCTSCIEGYFLSGNSCLPCSTPCKTCSNSSTQCKSCIEDYSYNSSTNSCIKCLDGYYLSNNNCLACDSPCKSCLGSSYSCRSCIENYEYRDLFNFCAPKCQDSSCIYCSMFDSSKCYQCTEGFYLSDNSCFACDSSCKSCYTPTSCSSCIENYQYNYLTQKCSPICHSFCQTCIQPYDNTQCSSCIDGYYISDNSCLACDSQCKSCSGSSTQCTECFEGHALNPETYQCQECHSSCETCSYVNSEFCMSCKIGYYLDMIDSVWKCVKCNSSCKSCVTELVCDICQDGYELDERGVCKPICDISCETCSSPQDKNACLSCLSPLILKDQQCLKYFCHQTCKDCIGNEYSSCISCVDSREFIKISDDYGTCECPSNTSDFNEQICEQSSTQEEIKTTVTVFFATSVASLSILSIISVNPVLMLSFLEFSQSVSHLRYINQRQPLGFDQVTGIISYSHFSELLAQSMDRQDFKRILQEGEQNQQKMQVNQENVKLKLSNKTHYFITNAYLILIIQTLSWILSFLSIFLERKYSQNIFKQLKKMFKISFPIVVFVVCSQEMWLLIFYQLQTINFDSKLDQISSILCILSLLYMSLFLGYLFYQLEYKKCIKYDEKNTIKSQQYQNSENPQNIQNQEFIKNLEIFYIISKYVKQNNFMTRNIVQIIILQKLIISCANVYIAQNPIIQINVIIFCNAVMIFYLVCFKPFKTIKGTILLIIIYILEILIAFLYSLTVYLQNELPASKNIPLSIITLIIIVFALFSSYSYVIIIKKIYQIAIQKNKKKIQNNPQIINSQQQQQQQQQQKQQMSIQVIQNQSNNSDQIRNQTQKQQEYMSFQKNYNHKISSQQTHSLKIQQEQPLQQQQNNMSQVRNQNENSDNNKKWNIFLQNQKPNENDQNPYGDSLYFNNECQKEQQQSFKLKQQISIQNDQNANNNIEQINRQQEQEQQVSLIKIESEESIN